MFSIVTGEIAKASQKTLYHAKAVYIQAKSILGFGNNIDDIDIVFPYGDGSIPPEGSGGIFCPVNGSAKKLYLLGTLSAIPPVPHEFEEGESWKHSQKYILVQQNDGIVAYRISDEEFKATMPNGESFVQMMLNRINEMEQTISVLNSNYQTSQQAFNTHTHISAAPGNPTGTAGASTPPVTLTQIDIENYATLNKDKTYLNDGKSLVDDLGENYES